MVFLMMLTVATADIGAYFAGKQLGRHPLALAISPSKTWEGFWGGMACVAALVFILVAATCPLPISILTSGSLARAGAADSGRLSGR